MSMLIVHVIYDIVDVSVFLYLADVFICDVSKNRDSKVSIFASGGRELKDQTSLPCRIFSGKCTWNYGKPLDGVASNNIECQRRDWCSLQIGDLVEVYCSGSDGVGGMWSLGVVIGTKTDSKDCVRFVEVIFYFFTYLS